MQREEKQDETAVEAVSALLLSAQEPVTSFSRRNEQMAMSLKSEFMERLKNGSFNGLRFLF